MKKVFITLAIFGSFYTTQSFAQAVNTPTAVTESLEYSFTNVKQASWSKVEDFYKAEFIFEQQLVSAYFNEEGELIATGRNISQAELPIMLLAELKNKYKDYTMTSGIEVDLLDTDNFYITLESATKKLQLKSNAYGKWETYQKSEAFKLI